jgi:hypothetical protein
MVLFVKMKEAMKSIAIYDKFQHIFLGFLIGGICTTVGMGIISRDVNKVSPDASLNVEPNLKERFISNSDTMTQFSNKTSNNQIILQSK